MRKIVLFILLLGILPVIDVAGQSNNNADNSDQSSSRKQHVKLTKKLGRRRGLPMDTFIEAFAHNDNLTISFTAPPVDKSIVIIISTEDGGIIYRNSIAINDMKHIDIPLHLNETENYLLEKCSGTSYYYGYF